VIAYLGVKAGHIDPAVSSVVIFAFVFTSLATPSLFTLSRTLPQKLGPWLGKLGFAAPDQARRISMHGHAEPVIVVLGYHRMAAALLQDIGRQQPDLLPDIVVVDVNVRTHAAIKQQGVRVLYGDAGSAETLRHAGVESAKLVISTVPDDMLRGTNNRAIVRAVRGVNKAAAIFACASRASDVDPLYEAGATYVYMPSAETANGVFLAGMALLDGQLESFRDKREAACGPLQMRNDVEGMST
jgi:voltage-gated potassium channel Kch